MCDRTGRQGMKGGGDRTGRAGDEGGCEIGQEGQGMKGGV